MQVFCCPTHLRVEYEIESIALQFDKPLVTPRLKRIRDLPLGKILAEHRAVQLRRVVRGADTEHGSVLRRIKCQPRDHAINLGQQDGHFVQQALTSGGRLIPFCGPGQKFVLKEITKTLQSAAHRGLTQPQTPCCTGDTALFQQGNEVDQEVEVGISELCQTYSHYAYYAWELREACRHLMK